MMTAIMPSVIRLDVVAPFFTFGYYSLEQWLVRRHLTDSHKFEKQN
jgi:hypothetical protein